MTKKTTAKQDAPEAAAFDIQAYLEEKVPVTVSAERDITVTLNGVNYRIKGGHTVSIPRKAALVIEQAAEQCGAAAELTERLSGKIH